MLTAPTAPIASLRVMCLEDNPLIVFHLEQMLEDLGHVFVGSFNSFAELKEQFEDLALDCALIDIDLMDGRTGPDAAAWLFELGVPSLFVTGQESIAREHQTIVVGVVSKPVSPAALGEELNSVASALGHRAGHHG